MTTPAACDTGSAAAESPIVETFAAKPFVQSALESPFAVDSVLSFFYGVDCTSVEGQQGLKDGSCLAAVTPLWFGAGGTKYDELCASFTDVVRAAGTRTLPTSTWNESTAGLMAQIILVDQLARNIFRATTEAFAYDEVGLTIARQLVKSIVLPDGKDGSTSSSAASSAVVVNAKEDLTPSYLTVIIVVFMHSEDRTDHAMCLQVIDHAKAMAPDMTAWWDLQHAYELSHKAVVDRFGRYPHRNRALNRSSTDEEVTWLADTDNLPDWAKSQG